MSDLRGKLNVRREKLLEFFEADSRLVELAAPDDPRYLRAARNLEELRDVENAIATFQLTDAQREVAAAQREVAESQRVANDQSAAAHSQQEELNFWFRRLIGLFGVANGAGLVAVLNFMFNKDSPIVGEDEVRLILQMYGLGAFLALGLPVIRLIGIFAAQEKFSSSSRAKLKGVMDVVVFIYASASAGIFIIATMIVMWNATDVYASKIDRTSTSTAPPAASAPPAPVVTITSPPADPDSH